MNARLLLWLSGCFLFVPLTAQSPILAGGLENRNQVFQDSFIMSTISDVSFTLYAESNGSYLTSDILPFLLLLEKDTVTSVAPVTLKGITVFPNPVTDQLIIQREITDAPALIWFTDAQGREVRRFAWPVGVDTYQIATSRFPVGKYQVSIMEGNTGSITTFQVLKL